MVPGFQPTEVMEDPAWIFNLEEPERPTQLLADRTDPDMPELLESLDSDEESIDPTPLSISSSSP